jgi:hypothetical protein
VAVPFKYNEENYLDEIRDFILKSYSRHYSGKNSTQTFDVILSSGHAKSFCVGNMLKYPARLANKDWPREDILKSIHYHLLLLHALDSEKEDV